MPGCRTDAAAILTYSSNKQLMRRQFLFALLAVVVAATASTLGAQSVGAAGVQGLTLAPGDLVRVQIWREPDLGGEFPVDEDGIVVLPLLGARPVIGIPVRELRETLTEAYREHLVNPSITITPLRRIHVLGEVQRPGLYALDPTVTLAGAVAMAGGATAQGKLENIRIVRDGAVLGDHAGLASTLSQADIRSGDQVLVERRGWFERNSTFVVSTILSVTTIAITILRRR
jgi:protein involved in polysaccharide export with SLBB domain